MWLNSEDERELVKFKTDLKNLLILSSREKIDRKNQTTPKFQRPYKSDRANSHITGASEGDERERD